MASKKYVLKAKTGQFLEGEMCSKCTMDDGDLKIKTIKRFKEPELALSALEEYSQTIKMFPNCTGMLYLVTDYYVEECQFDDFGNQIGEGKILAFAKVKQV